MGRAERRMINSKIDLVLSSACEYLEYPKKEIQDVYMRHPDKGTFIDDLKYMVQKIKDGTAEMRITDKGPQFVDLEETQADD